MDGLREKNKQKINKVILKNSEVNTTQTNLDQLGILRNSYFNKLLTVLIFTKNYFLWESKENEIASLQGQADSLHFIQIECIACLGT